MRSVYAGLMTGTSLDGIDGVLASFDETGFELAHHAFAPFPAALRQALEALILAPQLDFTTWAQTEKALSLFYAQHLEELLRHLPKNSQFIAAGCHGQTLEHRPELGFSFQMLNPALIAEQTGCHIVYDFRRRDLAAGGQGAPLVPAFHLAYCAHADMPRVLINLGGIANVTWLPNKEECLGFDTGPANTLLDSWYQHLGLGNYDQEGRYAASAPFHAELLEQLLDEPYFQVLPPKSTGREKFNLAWLEQRVGKEQLARFDPAQIMATLVELTCCTLSQAIDRLDSKAKSSIFIAGGGAKNHFLMQRLQEHLAPRHCQSSLALGIAEDQMEALAFAWLAFAFFNGQKANLPSVTGARHRVPLGHLCPGRARSWL